MLLWIFVRYFYEQEREVVEFRRKVDEAGGKSVYTKTFQPKKEPVLQTIIEVEEDECEEVKGE